MKPLSLCGIFVLLLSACGGEISKEKLPIVNMINETIGHIDSNHRVQILEDDIVSGDSLIKIRGYSMEDKLQKIVAVTHTPHFEQDDYFYFDTEGHVIFSGHLINKKDERLAAEYKYYYDRDQIVESLFWEDHYEVGKKFPHEKFREFEPNMDSLLTKERERITFLMSKLEGEGFVIKHLNENLKAN
ncbi:MAG: hypothetical protein AAGA85_11850 [Bacteroidota bacterium]